MNQTRLTKLLCLSVLFLCSSVAVHGQTIADKVKGMEKFPGFFPVFGEIHSFTASDGREVSTTSPTAQLERSLLEVA